MRFPLAVGVLVAVGVANAAPVPKGKPKPKDEDAILGAWQLETMEVNGKVLPAATEGMRFTFKKGNLQLSLVGKPKVQDGTFKLDTVAKPKAIDIDEGRGRNSLGIYELDGNKLKICLDEGKAPARPTEFKAARKGVLVFTLTRVAEDK